MTDSPDDGRTTSCCYRASACHSICSCAGHPCPKRSRSTRIRRSWESARTHASAFVAETEIEELPIAGRRYLRLAELTPAVTQDAATGGVSVMDLPSAQNRILIDGFDHTSSITGDPIGHEGPSRVPYQVSQWSVQAFRIHTDGAPAENGRAGASVINVVTKSGANEWHASGYEFFGDRALNGKTTLDERAELHKPPYRSHQFGGVVGGPILRDHNFFLVSYDGLRRIDSTSAAPDLTPFFGAGPVAVGRLAAALARTARDQDQEHASRAPTTNTFAST